ncbi:unnamed protein product, partial [Symbiodinium microadriaticum]
EQSRLLDSARAREVALREEIQDAEETNRVLRAASVRRGADAERLEELEHENETLKRQQSKWQQHLALTEEQAARTLESEKELDEARRELAAQRDLIEELRDQALRLGQDAREAEALAQKEIDYLQGRVATLEESGADKNSKRHRRHGHWLPEQELQPGTTLDVRASQSFAK